MKKILCIVGTRPEAIKMAPVILGLREEPWADVRVLATAQHREMLDQVLELFGIEPDIDLDLMRPDQSLPELTSRLFRKLDGVLASELPDLVLAQGDTTTVMVAAVASFYRRIKFGHVEAGLRTHDKQFPFPEEMNRVFVGYTADLHFAPTETARKHLLLEQIDEASVYVTGNTVIDALLHVRDRLPATSPTADARRTILVTAHRRENFGEPMENVCGAVNDLLASHEDVDVLWPVHPNPNVSDTVHQQLSDHPRVTLCEPLDYQDMVRAMDRCYLVMTDSGGIQEEAPALGKPVLVLRAETERPEAIEFGVVELLGTDRARIVETAGRLLTDEVAYRTMAKGVSPYGDGHAAERIVRITAEQLGVQTTHASVADHV